MQSSDETGIGIQVLLVGRDASGAITSVGTQERAWNINYTSPATVTTDPDDEDTRYFVHQSGDAELCEVVWKNRNSKSCQTRDVLFLPTSGAVDKTPEPAF